MDMQTPFFASCCCAAGAKISQMGRLCFGPFVPVIPPFSVAVRPSPHLLSDNGLDFCQNPGWSPPCPTGAFLGSLVLFPVAMKAVASSS